MEPVGHRGRIPALLDVVHLLHPAGDHVARHVAELRAVRELIAGMAAAQHFPERHGRNVRDVRFARGACNRRDLCLVDVQRQRLRALHALHRVRG